MFSTHFVHLKVKNGHQNVTTTNNFVFDENKNSHIKILKDPNEIRHNQLLPLSALSFITRYTVFVCRIDTLSYSQLHTRLVEDPLLLLFSMAKINMLIIMVFTARINSLKSIQKMRARSHSFSVAHLK